ncbi:unnamed protein product [Calicophoron daubneyi]|uniref:RING-type domain-containing protein n=1 Tax=Calicophoron daubneyi TaxID=300641 RepID=A0AAV2T2Z8_CALDB
MGIPVERFLSNIDPNLICDICHGVLLYPVVTECGHTFCISCLDTWLKQLRPSRGTCGNGEARNLAKCPVCRHEFLSLNASECFSSSDMTYPLANSVARPVFALRKLIGSLLTHCEHASRGCTAVEPVDVMELGEHKLMCAYAPVECAGCGTTVNRMELATHQLSCFGIQAELSEPNAPWVCRPCGRSLGGIDKETQTDDHWFPDHLLRNKCEHQCEVSVQTNCALKTVGVQCKRGFQTDHLIESLRFPNEREKEHLQYLNQSLVKLVYALKFELESTQTDLQVLKLQRNEKAKK